jgi:hypothetical protein
MSASKLSIYQGACQICGDRKVVSLTENRSIRKELDLVFDRDGILTCLQAGLWNFATRSVQLDYSPSVEPAMGFQYAFNQPEDFLRTVGMFQDEFFNVPLLRYQTDSNYWFSDLQTLYLRYVSDDVDFGMDYSKWPENFTRYVEHYFAFSICDRVTASQSKKDDIGKDLQRWKKMAASTDAMEEPTRFLPPGSWTTARRGTTSRRDRGNRGSFLG